MPSAGSFVNKHTENSFRGFLRSKKIREFYLLSIQTENSMKRKYQEEFFLMQSIALILN